MMMQTINKMQSYAQGTGYRNYPITAESFARPAYFPMPMASMRRPIYRMPAYMPIHRMRMAPSMAMRMYLPPPPRFGFMPPRAAAGSFASASTMSGMSAFGGMSGMSGMSGMGGMGGMGSSLGGMDEMSSMGDMSNLDSSSLEGSSDLSSALGGGDSDEYKIGGEGESYKMPEDDSTYSVDDSGDDKSEYSMDPAMIQGGSMDTSKLGEGDGSMTLDDASDVKGDSPNSPQNYDSTDNSPPAGYEGSLDDTSDNSDDSGYKGSDDSSDDMMPNLPVYTTGSSKKANSEKSPKKSPSKKSRQPKGKKLNYKAMYEMLKAYHDEKRDAANDYNSGDSGNNNNNNNNNEYVTMYRNQVTIYTPNYQPMKYSPVPNSVVVPSSLSPNQVSIEHN